MYTHAIDDDNTATSADTLRFLPPFLNLGGTFSFWLAIGKPAGALLSTHNQNYIVSQPGLHVGDDAAVVAAQRLLQIDDVGLQMTQDMDVAVGGGKWQDHGFLFNQTKSLRVDGVVDGIGGAQTVK